MAKKKFYPGGFRLTKKTAAALAVQEFGTAKGLEMDTGTSREGYFRMKMGNLCVSICPDIGMSGCIKVSVGMSTASHRCVGYFNPETLEPDYDVMDRYERREKREALEQWVYDGGPEPVPQTDRRSLEQAVNTKNGGIGKCGEKKKGPQCCGYSIKGHWGKSPMRTLTLYHSPCCLARG